MNLSEISFPADAPTDSVMQCRRALVAVVAFLAMLVGCNSNPTVWKKDFASPDGAWLATARTDQWGGFGSAALATTVSLRRVDGTVDQGKPFDVLSYDGGRAIPKAYVLSDANADADLKRL